MKRILLSHGGGGKESWELIEKVFLKHFSEGGMDAQEDAAIVRLSGNVAITTDGFTVKPLFFPGGDIGKLAVAGTVNDLAVMGAKPLFMSVSFIIEEGFLVEELKNIVASMSRETAFSGVKVVAGDTKVVPSGQADGLFISSTGVGVIKYPGLSATKIKPGDVIIVSGSVGDHGACVLISREGLEFESQLASDCASLWSLVDTLLSQRVRVHAMRDPTRGGLSAVLHEWAVSSGVSFLIEEESIPVKPEVRGLCEFLGLEPYHLACEGRVVMAIEEEDSERALEILREHPLGKEASIIGRTMESSDIRRVVLRTTLGTERVLEPPSGELLPRIC